MELKLKQQLKFGSIYVRYEGSDEFLIYYGDTVKVQNETKKELQKLRKDGKAENRLFIFKAKQEVREKFNFSFAPRHVVDELRSSREQADLDLSLHLEFACPNRLNQVVDSLLAVKKRNLSNLVMNLCKTIAQQSKCMDKLCDSAKPIESLSTSLNNSKTSVSSNDTIKSDYAGIVRDDSGFSLAPSDMSDFSAGNCDNVHICILCFLQRSVFKILKELRECLNLGLDICARIENVSSDLLRTEIPSFSLGKRFRMGWISELRCDMLLSTQLLRVQSLYMSKLAKMQALLLALVDHCDNKHMQPKDSNEKELSEEIHATTGNLVTPEKHLETCTSNVCHLSNNKRLQFATICALHQFLDLFVKYSKILKPLESTIIQVFCGLLEEEESGVAKSFENMSEVTEKKFKNDNFSLKHRRNPYGKKITFARPNDLLRAVYVDKLPHGEGTLCALDNSVIYQGRWRQGKRHGFGKGLIGDWSILGEYKGNWKSNFRHGFGLMVFRDGSVYNGEWELDTIQGHGVMKRFDGSILEGFWKDRRPTGCVKFTWPHGAVEYREYEMGRVVRVHRPHRELSPSNQIVKLMDTVSEERTYYKHRLRCVQDQVHQLKDHCEKQEKQGKQSIEQERKEKIQIVVSLRQELRNTRKTLCKETQKLNELRQRVECQICMNSPKDCLLLPCLHFSCCGTCVEKLKARESPMRCPTCRQITNGEIHCKFS